MTDLKNRLDELARQATLGVNIDNPASRTVRSAPRGLVWLVVGAVIVIIGIVGFVVIGDDTPDVVVAADQPDLRPAIFDRAMSANCSFSAG